MSVTYCQRCLNVSTRPNILFSEDGLRPPCKFFVHSDDIDWDERKNKREEIIVMAKSNNHSGYDCIVGVSRGKDSTRQAYSNRKRVPSLRDKTCFIR